MQFILGAGSVLACAAVAIKSSESTRVGAGIVGRGDSLKHSPPWAKGVLQPSATVTRPDHSPTSSRTVSAQAYSPLHFDGLQSQRLQSNDV